MDSKKDEILKRRSKLSSTQRELLSKRLRGEVDSHSQLEIIPKRSQTSPVPLSFGQQRLWFLYQLEPSNPYYSQLACLQLLGALNVDALEQSLNQIVLRHEALRTTFALVEEQVVQVIHPTLTVALPVVNLRLMTEAVRQAEVERLTTDIAQKPFDLAFAPLLRVTLLQTGVQEYLLLFAIHHIVIDGWSIGVLIRELAALYEANSCEKTFPLRELPIQYADYAVWQRQWMQGAQKKTQLSYWKQQLADASTLALPTDRPRPPVQSSRGAVVSFKLSPRLTDRLRSLSSREGVTLFMTLLAAFQTLLYRYTGLEDICVGFPIANRNQAEIQELIGFFVNTLVLRTDLSSNPSFLELLGRVSKVCIHAYAHADIPFEQLVEELQPERNLSHMPLFQVMLAWQEDTQKDLTLPGLTLNWLPTHSQTAKFDLTLYMVDAEPELTGSLEYNTNLFNAETITRMVEHFCTLLEGIVAHPQTRLSDLPLLTKPERQTLLVKWNDTKAEYLQHQCIHHLFEAQVERTPDAVAVVFEDSVLTYCELNASANQLAHYLRSLGVGPEVLVGICVERSLDMVVGLLSILKAGGAYVPLDPTYPKERLSFILEEAQVSVLLTQGHLVEAMPQHKAKVVCLDADWLAILKESKENLVTEVTANNLVYVIYTSGSTGRPKGVMIKHQSTVAMLDWAQKTFAAEALAEVLTSTSICFDLSVFEIFVPLGCGGKVILVGNALHLPTSPAAKNVTLINTVPSLIAELLRADGIPASVHTINIAGEPLQNKLVQQLYQWENIQQVFNLYGPSEDTTYSTFAWIHKGIGNIPPIGRPINNTQVYLLDQKLQPVPVGVPGEMYIGGDGLARGYLNRPQLTAEKFIPNPFSKKLASRLYKTGDLARYLPNGEIEYIGRIDNQVKVSGFRIELGEIEAHLRQHPKVRETVVVVRSNSADSQRIVAYVVPQKEQTLTITELRDFLESKLPKYMVPAAFVMLEALPLTPNGKVDRKALPALDTARPELEAVYQPPQTEVEQTIAKIWLELLHVEDVGIYDNFFELGGHSLLLLHAHNKLHKIFESDLSVLDLFRYPTISSLANYLNKVKNKKPSFPTTDINIKKIEAGKAYKRKRQQNIQKLGNI